MWLIFLKLALLLAIIGILIYLSVRSVSNKVEERVLERSIKIAFDYFPNKDSLSGSMLKCLTNYL